MLIAKNLVICLVGMLLLLTGCQNEDTVASTSASNNFIIESNLNETSNEEVLNINFSVLEETNRNITLTYTLSKFVSDGKKVIEDRELYNDYLSTNEEIEFSIPLNLEDGKYNIDLQALTEFNAEGERWGALRNIIFTSKEGEITVEYEGDVNE